MRYLNKKIWTTAICALVICISFIYGFSPLAAKIINGSTPDDVDEQPCSEQDLVNYVEKVKKDIGSKWQPIKGFEDRNVVVMFTVHKNGKIDEAKVIEGSGSQAVDKSALEALKAASPLAPLPKGAPESIGIRYVFSWHVTRQ